MVISGATLPDIAESLVERLRTHLRNGTTDLCPDVMHLPRKNFTDPTVAEIERTRIFGRVPFIAAHSSELPGPQSFVTRPLPRNEAVLVRGDDGRVRTFVNMCRHRGALLEPRPEGTCRVFSCIYHGWSYDLDGSLRNITYSSSFGPVDTSALGLIELPTQECAGFVWVVDDPDASIDVAAWLGPDFGNILVSYELDQFVCYRLGVFDEPANWKVLHDAFLDGYHIKFAHPRSAGKYIHTNIYAVDDYGSHARFASPRKSLDQWLDDEPGEEPLSAHMTLSHFVGPNCTLLRHRDHFQLLSFFPSRADPGTARMEMRVLVPSLDASGLDEEAWRAKWDKNWEILMQVLRDEDFPVLRNLQRATTSESGGPLILGRNEVLNQAFHREIARLVGSEPT
jgi:phenylpropionate dioxygenase-like ring-hydroxylating dioxygenase large terminal subunit